MDYYCWAESFVEGGAWKSSVTEKGVGWSWSSWAERGDMQGVPRVRQPNKPNRSAAKTERNREVRCACMGGAMGREERERVRGKQLSLNVFD